MAYNTKENVKKSPQRKTSSKSKNKKTSQNSNFDRQKNQTLAVVLFTIAILLLCIVIIPGDNLWNIVHNVMKGLFGICSILIPIILSYISISTALEKPIYKIKHKILAAILVVILFSTAVYIFSEIPLNKSLNYINKLLNLYSYGIEHGSAGLVGGILGIPFVNIIGEVGSKIIILLMIFVTLMILTGTELIEFFKMFWKPAELLKTTIQAKKIYYHDNQNVKKALQKNKNTKTINKNDKSIDINLGPELKKEDRMPLHPVISPSEKNEKNTHIGKLEYLKKVLKSDNLISNNKSNDQNDSTGALAATAAFIEKRKNSSQSNQQVSKSLDKSINNQSSNFSYTFPPLDFLSPPKTQKEEDITNELQTYGSTLVDTLKSFGVQTKIVDISRGPAVTRFELQPAAGVKISKITNLADDIALNLAASGVRIEAPIPGKAAVGIEIPNKAVNIVTMRELIASNEFNLAKSNLTVALGKDIAGNVTLADLAKMPHLLIAGSTGSGKSVCINSLIISLLYKSTPEQVRFLMVDPKVVELGTYNGIPHLLIPVVTDPEKAAGALNWAVNEMLKRYKIFAENNVRDLFAYNKMVKNKDSITKIRDISDNNNVEKQEKLEPMPQIVIIIDELADLMMAAPNEVEDSICRLAQMARAAGMHLVIATQRPSVDVITGIIKANIPSRIAFAVSSQVDSRTILDMGGAEKLLGRGDMLFSPIGASKPIRVQGCFVTDEEIEKVTDFVKKSKDMRYDEKIIDEIEKIAVLDKKSHSDSKEKGNDNTDPMLDEAIKCVFEAGQASTSQLQRRLRLGYARAGRLIDEMENMGIIGPYEGAKPRKILMSYQQFIEKNNKTSNQ